MADPRADTLSANAASNSSSPATHSSLGALRVASLAAGLAWSVLFVVVGLAYGFQMYGDGAIFSYSIAVLDSWAYHWHDISDRSFIFLFSHEPAQLYVALTRDAHGGILIYGFLQFVAPLLGLVATWFLDQSPRKIFFSYACFSTAVLCPLVFGFPTEMWMAHSLFWPALAICHYANASLKGMAAVFAVLLALGFTHPGALVLEVAILVTLALRGFRDPALLRTTIVFLVVVALRSTVKALLPPDAYMNDILYAHAFKFIDVTSLTHGLFLVLTLAIAGYALVFFVLRPWVKRNHVIAAAIIAASLAIYWLRFDHSLHTEARYFLRTALLIFAPILAGFASLYVLDAEGRLKIPLPLPFVPRLMAVLAGETTARFAIGALVLSTLVHGVETFKFASAWTNYKAAIRTLATGTVSDPDLGDPRFVSTARNGADRSPLSWFSTTEFLSILVSPGYAPTRLVLDPDPNRFVWLSCRTATATYQADRAIPKESRDLVRVHACLANAH